MVAVETAARVVAMVAVAVLMAVIVAVLVTAEIPVKAVAAVETSSSDRQHPDTQSSNHRLNPACFCSRSSGFRNDAVLKTASEHPPSPKGEAVHWKMVMLAVVLVVLVLKRL